MMEAQSASETLEYCSILMQVVTREDFIINQDFKIVHNNT
jgi:hypothetical protein